MIKRTVCTSMLGAAIFAVASLASALELADDELAAMKQRIIAAVDSKAKQAQVMNDMIFSFGELGFQEFETSAYLTKLGYPEGALSSPIRKPGVRWNVHSTTSRLS